MASSRELTVGHSLVPFACSNRRLLALDYDGTLTDIVSDPKAAVPSQRLVTLLERLTANTKNVVWVISGRDQRFLEQHLGSIEGLGLCAEHGGFIRYPNSKNWRDGAEIMDMTWKDAALKLIQEYAERLPGSAVECKRLSITLHFRCYNNALYELRERLDRLFAQDFNIHIVWGKWIIEVRLKGVHKGAVVYGLMRTFDPLSKQEEPPIGPPYHGDSRDYYELPPDYVLCMGDDTTDEDMFNVLIHHCALPEEYISTWYVGPLEGGPPTLAKYRIASPNRVIEFLERLAAV